MTAQQLRDWLNALPLELLGAQVDVATFDGRYAVGGVNCYLRGKMPDGVAVIVIGHPIIFEGYAQVPDVSWVLVEVK